MAKIGAIFFDTGNDIVGGDINLVALKEGWASIAGDNPFRVSSIHELPTDVIWYTNLVYSKFQRAGLGRHPNFRSDDWLRTSNNQIQAELGINQNDFGSSKCVQIMGLLANRVVNTAIDRHNIVLKNAKLNADFAQAFNLPKSTISDRHYPFIEPIAAHSFISVIHAINYMNKNPTLTVRPNRLYHARAILSTPVPADNGWTLMEFKEGNGNLKLESIDTPFLAQCSLSNINPMIAEILSWGSGSQKPREWLTNIEWNYIKKFADITVTKALVANEAGQILPQINELPEESTSALSYTNGLIAEQVWTAITSKQYFKPAEYRFSAAAAWLRAADRMIMLDHAQKLFSKGLTVSSYGTGNVVIRVPDRGLRHALDVAINFDLLPPASRFLDANFEEALT